MDAKSAITAEMIESRDWRAICKAVRDTGYELSPAEKYFVGDCVNVDMYHQDMYHDYIRGVNDILNACTDAYNNMPDNESATLGEIIDAYNAGSGKLPFSAGEIGFAKPGDNFADVLAIRDELVKEDAGMDKEFFDTVYEFRDCIGVNARKALGPGYAGYEPGIESIPAEKYDWREMCGDMRSKCRDVTPLDKAGITTLVNYEYEKVDMADTIGGDEAAIPEFCAEVHERAKFIDMSMLDDVCRSHYDEYVDEAFGSGKISIDLSDDFGRYLGGDKTAMPGAPLYNAEDILAYKAVKFTDADTGKAHTSYMTIGNDYEYGYSYHNVTIPHEGYDMEEIEGLDTVGAYNYVRDGLNLTDKGREAFKELLERDARAFGTLNDRKRERELNPGGAFDYTREMDDLLEAALTKQVEKPAEKTAEKPAEKPKPVPNPFGRKNKPYEPVFDTPSDDFGDMGN